MHPSRAQHDGTGTDHAVGDTQPGPATTIHCNTVRLHVDSQGMVWSSIDGGEIMEERDI
jgi:hypothetical protein